MTEITRRRNEKKRKSIDGEAAGRVDLHVHAGDVAHLRMRRPVPQPGTQRIARRGVAADQQLDPAFGKVARVAAHAHFTRLVLRRSAIRHSLHPAGDESASTRRHAPSKCCVIQAVRKSKSEVHATSAYSCKEMTAVDAQ